MSLKAPSGTVFALSTQWELYIDLKWIKSSKCCLRWIIYNEQQLSSCFTPTNLLQLPWQQLLSQHGCGNLGHTDSWSQSVKPSAVIEEADWPTITQTHRHTHTRTHTHSIDHGSGFQQHSGQLMVFKVIITGSLCLGLISSNKYNSGICVCVDVCLGVLDQTDGLFVS